MCMSTAYEQREGENILLCENVKNVTVDDKQVTLVDILGYTVTIQGIIKQVDLMKNIMLIEAV